MEDPAVKTQGSKVVDPILETEVLQWLVVPVHECPDEASERRIAAAHFRIPHHPWGVLRAFVRPVQIRRSRRRVLFRQQSGIDP
jgi:hypothetical protein